MEIVETGGLRIMLDSVAVRRGENWTTVVPPGLWFGIVLDGTLIVDQGPFGTDVWKKGKAAAFSTRASFETEHRPLADGIISAVFLQIDHEKTGELFGADALAAIERSGGQSNLFAPGPVGAIAWQMFGCTLEGGARRLYMTGKALEMTAHLLPGDIPAGKATSTSRWTPRDIECFHAARAILVAEYADPPSVPLLARRVGTNARKLAAGFNDLFGVPVYSFVKSRRLDEARLMLEAGETMVSIVARSVGYQPAHFATEFRKRFGVSPIEISGKKRIF